MKSSSILSIIAASFLSFSQYAKAEDTDYVTCGSAIKLQHTEAGNKYFLHSNGARVNSRGSSGQVLITASPDSNKMSALWLVGEGHGQPPCKVGSKIAYGTKIRLSHVETTCNLHSHTMRSPLSGQQEVTGFGEKGEGDKGDDWLVQPKRNSKEHYWRIGDEVFLRHAETNMYLGSSEQAKFTQRNCGHNCPVMNHLEVFGRGNADSFCYWKTTTGVYLYK
eukprot:CAMPEP_0203665476 /NCGR_PEP_ID=MMETSP0090-20130426/2684_1 /ASSEMBLY_ACC=CAM_ASM_001088 /TAXON_ID=426623 /ORGANISM="Chaetoceros affinis, Strain CCMP159" /LENGTH=220 /DNA_ID=CAMNT_0050529041 /DNA_START=94 /DNA_END=756 /DNA_ORIENTATION=+